MQLIAERIGRPNHRGERGMSLVELMIGIAVGMFVVAAAAMLTGSQLSDNRRLLVEAQVQQDLRSSLDIISRELRRSGASNLPEDFIWAPTATGAAVLHEASPNPRMTVSVSGGTHIDFAYDRRPGESGPFAFLLDAAGYKLKTQLAPGNVPDLTDPRSLKITNLTITPVNEPGIVLPCPKLCADTTTACWPTLVVRSYRVSVTGQAASDAAVQRTLQTTVRLRNDLVSFNDPLNPTRLCPI